MNHTERLEGHLRAIIRRYDASTKDERTRVPTLLMILLEAARGYLDEREHKISFLVSEAIKAEQINGPTPDPTATGLEYIETCVGGRHNHGISK